MRFLFGSKSKQKNTRPEKVEAAGNKPAIDSGDNEKVATEKTVSDAKQAMEETAPESAAVSANVVAPSSAFSDEKKNKRARDRSLYKGLLASLYDAVLIIDAKGFVIESNPRAEEFLGYDTSELWNKPCADLVASISLRVLAKLQAHVQTGKFAIVNTTCKRKDGSSFPAEIAINRMNLLHEDDLLFSIRNLEKRQRTNDAGDELENPALKHAGVGIAICDDDGLLEYVNPTFVSFMQCEKSEDLLGAGIADFCGDSSDVEKLLLKTGAQKSWFGHLEFSGAKGWSRKFIATSNIVENEEEAKRLTITLTPIPKRIG